MSEGRDKAMQLINATDQTARSFRLTMGLRRGYTGDKEYTVPEVAAAIGQWLQSQKKLDGTYLPGSLTPALMTYIPRGGDGDAFVTEPVIHYDGEVSPEYNSKKTDAEVLASLGDLSTLLAKIFGQERIYLRYRGILQILKRP